MTGASAGADADADLRGVLTFGGRSQMRQRRGLDIVPGGAGTQ
jgi:hypothetical protein